MATDRSYTGRLKRLCSRRLFPRLRPRFIWNRFREGWFEITHPDAPWFARTAINILDSWLRETDVGLEWGSGRSTLWFAQRVKHLTSVEHDRLWHSRVSQKIEDLGLRNVTYLFKPDVESGSNSSYVAVSRNISPRSLDFALVDGVQRRFCVLAVLPLLKPGGILILDNVDWYLPSTTGVPEARSEADGPKSPRWARFAAEVKDWRCIWTTNGVWDTSLWIKPHHTAAL